MIEVFLYTFMGFLIFYTVYVNVFGMKFTKKKQPYMAIILSTFFLQTVILNLVNNDACKDFVIIGCGFAAVTILAERKKVKAFLLFPVVYFLTSMINILIAYGIEALLGITHEAFCDSIGLMLVAESMTLLVFTIYGVIAKRKDLGEVVFDVKQYLTLSVGICCAFLIVSFSQGLLEGDPLINDIKDEVAAACVVMSLLFILLSIWQQITWKKAYKYRIDNEKYELFLSKQEEYIRVLTTEDERRRRLKHDIRAHMQALDTLAQMGELEMLRQYLHNMEESLDNDKAEKFTTISAVDSVISEWHKKAVERQAEWSWEGELSQPEQITIFELCTIFSNLLGNAVEAVEKVNEERRIKINISAFQGEIVLIIGNSCDATIKGSSKPETTKGDRTNHGLGLKNVEEIVQKLNGSIEYEMDNGWFQVTVVL